MFITCTDGPLLASLGRDLGKLTARSQQEKEESDGIAGDLEDVERTWEAIKAVLADAEKRQIREESVRLWLLELRGLAEKIEELRDAYEYEVVAKQVEAPPSSDTPQGEIFNSYLSNLGGWLHPKEVDGQDQAYHASSSSGVRRKVGSSTVASVSPLLDATFREQITRDIGRIKRDFEAIAKRKEALRLTEANGSMHYSDNNDGSVRSEPTGVLVADPVFLGRDLQREQLCALLKADPGDGLLNFEVIAVVGMGGMGKTTLAQHVCKELQIEGHFNKIVWVHVTQNFDVVRLTRAVVEHFEECKLNELSTLQEKAKELMKGKKVLLVMDDVWGADSRNWESFLAPFQHGPIKGSKILVTARLPAVAVRAKAVETINLSRLSEEEGWSLLKQHAFLNQRGDVNNIENLERIGRKIVMKCEGLPLSLKLLGGLLSYEKDEGVWNSVLESNLLELSNLLDPNERSDAGQKILGSLYLSYLHLSPKLQSCFKHCSRYPNGLISPEHLKQSWVAYDIVKDKREAARCLDALVSRSFLEVHKDKYVEDIVSMHDHIYDLAQYVQKEEKVSLRYAEEFVHEEEKVSIRYAEYPQVLNADHFSGAQHVFISFDGFSSFPINIALGNLCTFKLFCRVSMELHLSWGQYLRELTIDDGGFWPFRPTVHVRCQDRLKYLRIARIGNWEISPLWVLRSYNLRYLDMKKRELECFPESICNLRNLRGLSLNFPKLRYLPESISRLTNLQELHLTDASISCLPESISMLTNLQELHLSNTKIRCLPESVSKLVDLQELKLNGCKKLKELPESIVNLTNLQTLDLYRTYVSSMPKGIGALTKLTGLSRFFVGSEKAGLAELKNMQHLERAKIFNLCEVVNEEDALQAEMANKRHLRQLLLFWRKLERRDFKRILQEGPLASEYYQHEDVWRPAPQCEMPWEVNHQVQRRNDGEAARHDERTFERLRPCEKLEQVFIYSYRGYRLPSWMENGSFSKLDELVLGDIQCCTSLSPIDRLPSLDMLSLEHMSSLQELVPDRLQSATGPQQPFPKLRFLHIRHCDGIELLPLRKFPSLVYVDVHGCSNLKHMEPPYHTPCLLQNIYIRCCPKFKFSPDPQSPPPAWKLSTDDRALCRR